MKRFLIFFVLLIMNLPLAVAAEDHFSGSAELRVRVSQLRAIIDYKELENGVRCDYRALLGEVLRQHYIFEGIGKNNEYADYVAEYFENALQMEADCHKLEQGDRFSYLDPVYANRMQADLQNAYQGLARDNKEDARCQKYLDALNGFQAARGSK